MNIFCSSDKNGPLDAADPPGAGHPKEADSIDSADSSDKAGSWEEAGPIDQADPLNAEKASLSDEAKDQADPLDAEEASLSDDAGDPLEAANRLNANGYQSGLSNETWSSSEEDLSNEHISLLQGDLSYIIKYLT